VLVFEGKDAEEGLNYKFDHDKVTVPAGGNARVQLTVRPKKGKPKTLYNFQVLSRAAAESKTPSRDVKMLTGQLEYVRKRKFPWWIIPLILGLLAVAFAAVILLPKLFSLIPTSPPSPPSPPPSISLTVTIPNGNEKFMVGNSQVIAWTTTNTSLAATGAVVLEYSIDGGKSWITIDTVKGTASSFEWKVPDNPSTNCRIRATISIRAASGIVTAQDASDAPFTIFKNLQIIPIKPLPIEPKIKELLPIIPIIPKSP
jgi:hypothetical protein